MTTISIGRAVPSETHIVARLVHELLDELAGGEAPTIEAVTESANEILHYSGVYAQLAIADNVPVGVLVLNECAAIYAGGKFGEISELYVRPESRSSGMASRLISAAVAEARALGWKRLEVGAPNQPEWDRTLQFYLRNAFQEIGPRLRRLV